MPIKREDFNRGNFNTRHTGSQDEHPVTWWLRKHSGEAYTVDEIAKAIGYQKSTVRGFLRKLRSKGFVVHKAPYFMWKKNGKVRVTKKGKSGKR